MYPTSSSVNNNNDNFDATSTAEKLWTSVLSADQTRKDAQVGTAIMQYLKENPRETYASVEKMLREDHCFTHLIAQLDNLEIVLTLTPGILTSLFYS
jgi:hypothetical protein